MKSAANLFEEETFKRIQFLLAIGYKFHAVIKKERNTDLLFSKDKILFAITHNTSNECIDVFILFDFNTIENVRNLYYNSISLRDIFVLKSVEDYDNIMPSKVGLTRSIELVIQSLKDYGIEFLRGDKVITTREIFYKDKSPYGGQPYSKNELKKIALFESSAKKKL